VSGRLIIDLHGVQCYVPLRWHKYTDRQRQAVADQVASLNRTGKLAAFTLHRITQTDSGRSMLGYSYTMQAGVGKAAIAAGRERHIRDMCQNAINHDVGAPGNTTTGGLTDRQWLAQSVLNILDGTIDAQIRQEAADGQARDT
jgi:hypothetical protein